MMASFLVEQEKQEYKGENRAENGTESNRERTEMVQIDDSSNEISLGAAGAIIEETDTSAKKPPMGGDRSRASSSPDCLPEGAHQSRQGIKFISESCNWIILQHIPSTPLICSQND